MTLPGNITAAAAARARAVWRAEIIETVKLAWPMALTQLGQIAMMTTDLALIGRLGDGAIAAVRGVINIDSRGKPQQWAVTWNERRAAVKELQTAFGNDISKGPKAGQNYVQTAAALFARFLSEPGFNFLPSSGNMRPK